MKVSSLFAVALATTGVGAAPYPSAFKSDDIMALGIQNLKDYYANNQYSNATCTLENAAVRREWSTLSSKEKKEYIRAVQCLATKPAKTPAAIAAGAKNRYDDFVAIHINSTLFIHGTGNFLTWHRYFTWAYEQTLRNECGYNGTQPYYQWAYWAEDPTKSPALDGSATSLSGDGAFVGGRASFCIPSPDQCGISLPPSHGGGCVTSGPFTNWTVNLGPVSPALANISVNPDPSGLGYNPRCLRRDISKAASSGWTKDSDIVDLIQNNTDFLSFTTRMQGDFPNGFLGVHTGGHFTVGGDPGGDLFASPGDPYFFLHHSMIDRTYWTWQIQDIANRQFALAGTITLNNMPPSRNTSLSDPIDLGYVGVPVITIKDASNTLGGPFCYRYE